MPHSSPKVEPIALLYYEQLRSQGMDLNRALLAMTARFPSYESLPEEHAEIVRAERAAGKAVEARFASDATKEAKAIRKPLTGLFCLGMGILTMLLTLL